MYGKGPFGKAFDVAAQVVNGVCPICTEESIFVSLHKTVFRCTTCGSDCKQYINVSIRYLPAMSSLPEEKKDGETTKVGG